VASMGRRSLNKKAWRAAGAMAADTRFMNSGTRRFHKKKSNKGLRRQGKTEVSEQAKHGPGPKLG
jgi:hypothetical protein